ncbi:DUF1016 N-terminal domain-containing protein [Sphingobacterium faecale]|uniref:YhcG N-terminal domain-containing protein n=1 Tax=Sphingobacterium faecale TaxID=2803775 RepID=A0ABS1R770_9SPHI|nr:hypothetical protein [Sphingobacterium faecale]
MKFTKDFGRGFSQRNIEQMRQFYLVYSKTQTVSAQSVDGESKLAEFGLNWSHCLKLMRTGKYAD